MLNKFRVNNLIGLIKYMKAFFEPLMYFFEIAVIRLNTTYQQHDLQTEID